MPKSIELKTKTQTIYYEDSEYNLAKFYHIADKRISEREAKTILSTNGIEYISILKILTESVSFVMEREDFTGKIVSTEPYYKPRKQKGE